METDEREAGEPRFDAERQGRGPDPGQQDRTRVGQDEINLTEFPIALLSDRAPRDNPALRRFTSGDKVWEVLGHVLYGLPTRPDLEVYVVLTELTREQGFPERVQFSRHDLLQRLGWGTDARRYARLQQALDCWVGVTIRTTNAFFDKATGEWLRLHSFHLLEEFQILKRRRGQERGAAQADEAPHLPGWFRWSDTMRRSMEARYLKPLDTALFLTFRSAVAQQLYRYLDAKRLNGKPAFQQNLSDLGKQHLGLPDHYYPSQIKRELDRAHRELIATGFLASAHYEPMRGGGGEKVVYQFAPRRARASAIAPATDPRAALAPPTPPDPLVQRLVEAGVSPPTAADLAAERPEQCGRQLDYLPHREARDRAAVLVKAIREGWAPPQAWTEAQAAAEKKARRKQRREAERVGKEQAAEAGAAFDAWWARLPEAERQALTEQARGELFAAGPLVARHYERNPAALPEALRPILLKLASARMARRP
jgi:replication initiator protein A